MVSGMPGSLLAPVVGLLAGQIYSSDIIGLKGYRLPRWVRRFAMGYIVPFIGSTRAPRRSNLAVPVESVNLDLDSTENTEIVTTNTAPTEEVAEAPTTGTSVVREWMNELTGRRGLREPSATEIEEVVRMFPDVPRQSVLVALRQTYESYCYTRYPSMLTGMQAKHRICSRGFTTGQRKMTARPCISNDTPNLYQIPLLLLFLRYRFLLELIFSSERAHRNSVKTDNGLIAHVSQVRMKIQGTLTLLGSLMRTYLPSGSFMHMSVTVRTIPHPLDKETLSCAAKSVGLIVVVLRMTWRELSRGLARETYLYTLRLARSWL